MITTSRHKPINAVSLAAEATSTSVWMPCSEMVDKHVWILADGVASPDYLLKIRLSPHGYYEQRARDAAGTNGTDFYKEYTLAANHTATTLTEFDKDDEADLARACTSYQVVVTGNAGSNTATVTVMVEGFVSD